MDGFDFTWASTNGTSYRIRLFPSSGFSGTYKRRRLGGAPVFCRERNGRVMGSSVRILAECAIDSEFLAIYTSNNFAWKLELDTIAGAQTSTVWKGYVTAEIYEEPDIAPPYDIEITATDGLGLLKCYTVEEAGIYGPAALDTLLETFLGQIGFAASSVFYKLNAYARSWQGNEIFPEEFLGNVFVDLSGDPDAICYDVLSKLLDTLHAFLLIQDGMAILVDECTVGADAQVIQLRDSMDVQHIVNLQLQEIAQLGTAGAFWPVGHFTRSVQPARRMVDLKSPYEAKDSLLINSEMRTDSGWSKTGSASWLSAIPCYRLPATNTSSWTSPNSIRQTLSIGPVCRNLMLEVIAGAGTVDVTRLSVVIEGEVTDPSSPHWREVFHVATIKAGDNNAFRWAAGAAPKPTDSDWSTAYALLPHFDFGANSAGVQETCRVQIPSYYYNGGSHGRRLPSMNEAGYQDIGVIRVTLIGGLSLSSSPAVYVYSATLKDDSGVGGCEMNMRIDNGALSAAETVEVLPVFTSTEESRCHASSFWGFMYNGFDSDDVTEFKVGAQWFDHLTHLSRLYAQECALPRIRMSGTVDVPVGASGFGAFYIKDGQAYIADSSEFDMLEDNLQLELVGIPEDSLSLDVVPVVKTL